MKKHFLDNKLYQEFSVEMGQCIVGMFEHLGSLKSANILRRMFWPNGNLFSQTYTFDEKQYNTEYYETDGTTLLHVSRCVKCNNGEMISVAGDIDEDVLNLNRRFVHEWEPYRVRANNTIV